MKTVCIFVKYSLLAIAAM